MRIDLTTVIVSIWCRALHGEKIPDYHLTAVQVEVGGEGSR